MHTENIYIVQAKEYCILSIANAGKTAHFLFDFTLNKISANDE